MHKIVRVGSNLKAPRQRYSVNPVYPPLARDARIWGTVVVDAVIDEHGNVVQARVLSGHPLLIDAALKAVLQWKYEPTIQRSAGFGCVASAGALQPEFIRSPGVQRMRLSQLRKEGSDEHVSADPNIGDAFFLCLRI